MCEREWVCAAGHACKADSESMVREALPLCSFSFFLIRRSHSISFARAQGIPKYIIGFGRGKGWDSTFAVCCSHAPMQMACAAGRFSAGGTGSVDCLPCAMGFYSGPRMSSCTPCPAGYACPTAATPVICAIGRYSLDGWSACQPCPGGRFGATQGLTNESCTGPCLAGYACAAGSTTRTALLCPRGRFSGTAFSSCHGCHDGWFGNQTGLTVSTCSGRCAAGYFCPGGSTNATAAICPIGRYSIGAGFCRPCPAGRFGSSVGLSSLLCSGACNVPGAYCPPGSTSNTSVIPCPAGTYSSASTGLCVLCPASTPYSRGRSTSAASCSSCATNCSDGLSGIYACNDTTWTPWVDGNGTEGVNSCLRVNASASLIWDAANASCVGLGGGSHLLSTQQVGAPSIMFQNVCLYVDAR